MQYCLQLKNPTYVGVPVGLFLESLALVCFYSQNSLGTCCWVVELCGVESDRGMDPTSTVQSFGLVSGCVICGSVPGSGYSFVFQKRGCRRSPCDRMLVQRCGFPPPSFLFDVLVTKGLHRGGLVMVLAHQFEMLVGGHHHSSVALVQLLVVQLAGILITIQGCVWQGWTNSLLVVLGIREPGPILHTCCTCTSSPGFMLQGRYFSH